MENLDNFKYDPDRVSELLKGCLTPNKDQAVEKTKNILIAWVALVIGILSMLELNVPPIEILGIFFISASFYFFGKAKDAK